MSLATALTLPALFAAGLAASPHCGLMCGPLQAVQLRARGALPLPTALSLLHSGRVAGYALLGAAAGAFGAQLLPLLQYSGLGWWARLLPAAALVILGIACLRHPRQSCAHQRLPEMSQLPASLRLLVLGLIWALLPCALLYGLMFLASAAGSPAQGALLLAAFGLGTSPLLTATGGVFEGLRRTPQLRLQRLSGTLLLGLGIASISLALLQAGALTGPWCSGLQDFSLRTMVLAVLS